MILGLAGIACFIGFYFCYFMCRTEFGERNRVWVARFGYLFLVGLIAIFLKIIWLDYIVRP